MNELEVLRYGKCLVDDNISDGDISGSVGGRRITIYQMRHGELERIGRFVRVRVISYMGCLYYHKMVNGEVVEFKELK